MTRNLLPSSNTLHKRSVISPTRLPENRQIFCSRCEFPYSHDGSLRSLVEMNHYRSEDERHIDIHPSTRSLLSLLCHLLRFFGDVLASLLHRRGCLLCQLAQTVSGNPHLLHGLLCRVFHLTGCL